MKEERSGEIRVSVRNLVEFILRHGNIDNRRQVSSDDAMQQGGRIHRKIQRRMGAEYRAEVPLKYTLETERYLLTVEGRADGIILKGDEVIIDEIKGTYRELAGMREPMPLHLAQAKCYAYMYGRDKKLEKICVRMTYCHIPTEELRYFHEEIAFRELEEWFGALLREYGKWTDYSWEWRGIRQASISGLEFPFPYRQGQRDLAANVYRTIYHKKMLFLEAPTGVGKTITTIYPAVQAVGKGMGDKIFYLTAKTITRMVADDALRLLRMKGMRLKSVILTAKEKICFMEETECNPDYCPYARGHYDRINQTMYTLLTSGEESFSREVIEEYARRHMVCPFELCLDMSLYADAVIGDYNYLFDPHVYLKRFFGDTREGDYIFLIDEAHNLLERGRAMYSAVLWKEQFMELRKELKKTIASGMGKGAKTSHISGQLTIDMTENLTYPSEYVSKWDESVSEDGREAAPVLEAREGFGQDGLEGDVLRQAAPKGDVLDKSVSERDGWKGENTDGERMDAAEDGNGEWEDGDVYMPSEEDGRKRTGRHGAAARQGYAGIVYWLEKCNRELLALKRECEHYRIVDSIEEFVQKLMRLHAVMEDCLAEQEGVRLPVRETLLDFYFDVSHFLQMYDLLDEHYTIYTLLGEDGGFMLKLFCVNPRENLRNCMLRGRSSILFSATFLPIQYYKELLGGEAEDYEVYARSVFDPGRRALFIAGDVTSRYARRSGEEYMNMARYIEEVVKCRHGNYMVFCPSYAFLRTVFDIYTLNFGGGNRECVMQSESMGEADREKFLDRFRRDSREEGDREGALIGFCVLGGIFGEGIDLKKDSLIGVLIVGTGLPQVGGEREILRGYFDGRGGDGFDYAYRYPGMNKVLQAAGRVIRTVEDVGVIVLLDQRFLYPDYRKLFPREWECFETVTVNTVAKRVERFWDEWL